ncbi:NUDIX domain-containing protein [Metabacillus sp. Hm71]|uniref:NUDIX domain-containing protein n=1 Tax=Metabacillus sp. Hm71 TaxID=3450743 RepID=UPI003F431646
MLKSKRGNVWLAVAGIVQNEKGEWLVVKKKYGGLKGKWSLPAGFVEQAETIDQAVVREIREETGIIAKVESVIGIRSGVIRDVISDNMIIFKLQAETTSIIVQEKELEEAAFIHPQQLIHNPDASLLLVNFANSSFDTELKKYDHHNPGDHFGYTAYRLFL